MSASDITLSSGEHVLRPNVVKDASHAFKVVKSGGTAIWPNDVGYGIVGSTKEALQKIFVTKGRGDHKRNALLGDLTTQRSLHRLDTRSQEIIETITVDFNLPLGAIGPFQPEHPLLKRVDPELLSASTANGTVGMLLNAGPIYNELEAPHVAVQTWEDYGSVCWRRLGCSAVRSHFLPCTGVVRDLAHVSHS